jgi:hypothetical protein
MLRMARDTRFATKVTSGGISEEDVGPEVNGLS